MSKFYAQLDDNGVVHSVVQLKGEVNDSKLIPIDSMDNTLLKATYKDNKFTKKEKEPRPPKGTSLDDIKDLLLEILSKLN